MLSHDPTPEEFEKLVSEGKTVVDFWAGWCGPCRAQSPIVEELERSGKINLVKIDVDAEDVLTARYDVRSIPTLVLFDGGKQVARIVGLTSAEGIMKAFEG